MKHKKLGAAVLSVAAAFAVALPATLGTVYADATGTTLLQNESRDLDVAALEKYYEGVLASDEVRYGTVAGANTGGGACLWSGRDINPAYDNVTVSYTYTTTTPRTETYGFGFRFTVGGNKHVSLVRMKNRMPIVQYDSDLSVGRVRAKFFADEYYATVGGNSPGNKLGDFVNTDEYASVAATSEVNDRNGNNILTGMPSVFLNNTDLTSVSVVCTLRKITEKDEEGNKTVSFRYYEDGEYFFTLQFEEEVTAYAPNLVNPTASHLRTGEYKVTLNDVYTDYDKAMDANSAEKKTELAVGEQVTYTFRRRIDSTSNPSLTFAYNETGEGVSVIRFAKRIHLNPMTRKQTKGGTKQIYVKSLHTWGSNDAVDLCRADGVYTIDNTDASWDIAQNYGVKDQYTYAELTYTVERLANKEIDGTAYSVYRYSEGYNGESYAYAELGFPVEEGVAIYAWLWMTNAPDRIITVQSAKSDEMKNDETLNPERPESEVFGGKYAVTTESSVRYMADSQGLRFTANVTEVLVGAYQAKYGEANVSFGVKLVRADGAYAYIEAVNRTLANGKYSFNGVVTNIAQANYGAKYTPYVYIRYVDRENAEHYVLTEAGEAKSISEVCAAAIADVSDVKTDVYPYAVTVNGKTVYSRYTQSKLAIMKNYVTD